MGRSVYVSPHAVTVVPFVFEGDVDDDEYAAEYRVDDLACTVCVAFPSMRRAWTHRRPEGVVVAHNAHADLVLTEYAGIWALALIPRGDPVSGLSVHWCQQVEARLERAVKAGGGTPLHLIGRASNGEAFYWRAP